MKPEFSRQIFKNTQTSNFIEIHPVTAKLFHAGGRADGQTDITKLLVAFLNLANAPKTRSVPHRGHMVVLSERIIGYTL